MPVYPPPTTTTSASTSPASGGRGSGIPASSIHQPYGVCFSAIDRSVTRRPGAGTETSSLERR